MNDYERHVYEDAKLAYAALMKVYPLTLEDLPSEVWLPVPAYEGYLVSNFGRVKSFHKGKVKILKPVLTKRGYLRAQLFIEEKAKSFAVHRLVALAFVPNPESKPQVNHRDGNKFNNHVSNLEWCTRFENMRHAVGTGLKTASKGEDAHNAKLTNSQVQFIRNNPDGLTLYELAKTFGVGQTTISKIQLGKRYKDAGGAIRQSKRPRISKAI